MKAKPIDAALVSEAWVGSQGVRIYLREGKVRDIDLLPLGGKPSKARASKSPAMAKAIQQVKEFLQGTRKKFTVPFEQKYATAFHAKVYEKLMEVPYGQVVSYGELAYLAGAAGAARAVGSAMKRNRLCLLIPCHRVVAANGIGGYNGQIEWKRALLDLEKMTVHG